MFWNESFGDDVTSAMSVSRVIIFFSTSENDLTNREVCFADDVADENSIHFFNELLRLCIVLFEHSSDDL